MAVQTATARVENIVLLLLSTCDINKRGFLAGYLLLT